METVNLLLEFHVHESSDELFYVSAGEFIIVPKGVKHRPVVKELTKFLRIELQGTLTKENSGELYEDWLLTSFADKKVTLLQ